MPRIHPRERLIKDAEMRIKTAIIESTRHLTIAEQIQVINHVCHDEIGGIMKYEIRKERHGNTDTPGGWAPAEHIKVEVNLVERDDEESTG